MRGFRRNLRLATTLLGVSCFAGIASAQSVVRVVGDPCTDCIRRRVVLTLAGAENDMVGRYSIIARASQGRWLMSTSERSRSISVYDSTGKRLRDFSRRGQGPGEHASISVILVTRDDTVQIFDNVLRRRTVFSPSFEFIRSSSLPGPVRHAVELVDGSLVVNGVFATRSLVGYPLHRLNRNGSIGASFGTAMPGYRADAEHLLHRHIAASPGRGVWAVPSMRYEPGLWSAEGPVTELRRAVDWFPPVTEMSPPGLLKPPTPEIKGIWFDTDDRLWVMAWVPDRKWVPQPGAVATHVGRRTKPIIDYDREFDTIIEVVNVRTDQLIVSQRFDQALRDLLPGGFTSWYLEDARAEPQLQVWQLMLSNVPRGSQ